MTPRVEELIRRLNLQPHPEGGRFRETYRSPRIVRPADNRGPRAALTAIYYLLAAGEISRWHRVRADEIWQFCEGDPLELRWLGDDDPAVRLQRLGPAGDDQAPAAVIPADCWQAARTTGRYTLVSCIVAPGFEFEDFTLLADEAGEIVDRLVADGENAAFL